MIKLSTPLPRHNKLLALNCWWRACSALLLIHLRIITAASAQDVIWDKTIGGSGSETITTVKPTNDGGYVVGGFSSSPVSGDKTEASRGNADYWVVKYNRHGTKVWDKTYGGGGNDQLTSLQQTQDGGYILGGTSGSVKVGDKTGISRGGLDYWIVKLNADGTKAWDRTYGGSRDDKLTTILQTPDGGYLVGGNSDSPDNGDKSDPRLGSFVSGGLGTDYWVLKLNVAGGKVWDKAYGGISQDVLQTIIKTQEGDYLLAGFSETQLKTYEYRITKIKENGTPVLDKMYGSLGWDRLYYAQQTSDGGYILGGTSDGEKDGDKTEDNRGFADYWVIKVKADGTKQWDKTLGGVEYDDLKAIQQTPDGGYLIGGTSTSIKSGDKTSNNIGGDYTNDFWLVKLNAAGKFVSDQVMGGSIDDYLASIQSTPDGNLLLGGSSNSSRSGNKSQDSKGLYDYWIVKLNNFKKNQTIAFDLVTNQVAGDPAITLAAKSTANLPVSFEVLSGPATIAGNKLSVYGTGPVRISAYQKGNAEFNATEKTQTFMATLSGKQAEWVYGGNNADTLAAMVATPDGGYLIGGTSASGISGDKTQNKQGNTDYWVAKINKTGQQSG